MRWLKRLPGIVVFGIGVVVVFSGAYAMLYFMPLTWPGLVLAFAGLFIVILGGLAMLREDKDGDEPPDTL